MSQKAMDSAIRYRPAESRDAKGIRSILGYYIETSTASWRYENMDLVYYENMIANHQKPNRPFYVAEKDNQIIGFGYLDTFRAPEGYWPCVEDSVYVHPDHTGQGIGRRLLKLIIDSGRDSGLKTIIAAIDGENKTSIKLHQEFGFTINGILKSVAWKYNSFRDLVYMQLILDQETCD